MRVRRLMMPRKRRNAGGPASLTRMDSERQRLPASEVDLSPTERSMLQDPNWIDEDEADAIEVERIVRREGHQGIPLRDYLKSRGRTVGRRKRLPH
jgi:hypothetical protein